MKLELYFLGEQVCTQSIFLVSSDYGVRLMNLLITFPPLKRVVNFATVSSQRLLMPGYCVEIFSPPYYKILGKKVQIKDAFLNFIVNNLLNEGCHHQTEMDLFHMVSASIL